MNSNEATPLLSRQARQGRRCLKSRLWTRRLWWPLLVTTVAAAMVLLWCRPDIGIRFKRTWSSADYPPLLNPPESIRLLYLEPGSGSHRIECGLDSIQFVDHPSYSALSYTWGDPGRTQLITVNGKKLRVTENLWNALQSIRHPTERQTLWVDAICINQEDTKEKAQQVPLMAFIYSRAKEVLVWLGHHKAPRWAEKFQLANWPQDWAVDHAREYWGPAMYWIYRLVHQEYWKRAWIVQEIGMASTIKIYFGRQSIPWSELIELVNFYDQKVEDPAVRHILKLEDLRRSKYRDGQAYSVGSLLNAFRDSFCLVKHDKIYAFLGMANDFVEDVIPIDYSRPPVDIYQDLVVAQNLSVFEQARKRMDIVYLSGLVRQLLSRESSSKAKRLQWFGLLNDPDSYIYEGCGDERAWRCLSDESGNTTTALFMMDVGRAITNWALSLIFWPHTDVEAIWRPLTPESIDVWLAETSDFAAKGIEVRGVIASYVRYIGASYSDYLTYPDVSKRWAAAITGHYANETELRKARGQNERLGALIFAPPDFTIRNIAPLEDQFVHANSPRLFVGSGVRMGLVPPNAKIGDLICQFWNSSASAVLRRRENGVLDIVGRAAIITDDEEIEWDRPTDRELFGHNADNAIDLRLDITQLTRLSFDTVVLPGTGKPDEDDFPIVE